MRRLATLFALVTLAAVSVGASSALAAPRPKPAPANVTFEYSVVSGPDQVPNWGEQVTYTVQTTATSEPHVDLTCTQNGAVVLGATTGFYDSYPWPWTRVMTLSSNAWTGGAADCTARLYYFDGRRTTTLKTISFHADA